MAKVTLWLFLLRNWNTVWGAFVITLTLRIVVDVSTATVQFLQMVADGKIILNWTSLLIFVCTITASVANLILTATSSKFQQAKQKAADKKIADNAPSI